MFIANSVVKCCSLIFVAASQLSPLMKINILAIQAICLIYDFRIANNGYMAAKFTYRKTHISMIRKFGNHTLQTNPQYLEEETQITNSHKPLGRQIKSSNHLSVPKRDNC